MLAAVRLPQSQYDLSDPFGELKALAEQAGAIVVGELTQNLPKPVSATYMGAGKVVELKALCELLHASTIIFDHDLSPKQIANIEKETGRKVIDRSELILDIFASRATTREAQLQVELAQVEYTLPRLRAMWTHLERIVGVGGIGGIGTRGPGEQQLEIDRRLAQARRLDLVRELEVIQARKRREVRARKAEHFTVGLVGYTNAGKSTLFNTMTAGGAYADNRLFATLMTRTRQWDLGGGLNVMLSDTVGFVRDLPHNLIASFKATLEEAVHADVLLIVLDVSDPAIDLHEKTVRGTIDELLREAQEDARREGEEFTPPERIVLLNKADRLRDNSERLVWQQRLPGAIPLCALPAPEGTPPDRLPMGQAELIRRVRDLAQGRVEELEISLPFRQAKAIHLIETQGKVLDRQYDGESVTFRVQIGRRQVEQLRAGGARIRVAGEAPAARDGWTTP
ncbi:MAG: GTPase HflX [Phycisphaerales bacterium]|nr:GTPase HflX [Phycisphaerales bacterium]